MFELSVNVVRGIMLIDFDGELNSSNFGMLDQELNYLIYKQGMHYYIFNFSNLLNFDNNILNKLQNKIIEIFLNCGRVVMCGVNNILKDRLGFKEQLSYVNNEIEAFKYFSI